MVYPGYLLRIGTRNTDAIQAVQKRLNALGCGPLKVSSSFDKTTRDAVRLYQARATDLSGIPLKVDGIIGPLTWGGLFGKDARITRKTTSLLAAVLKVARRQVGVRERPTGSHRGPEVDEYIKSVGLDPAGHHAWCAAFVYWCFERASRRRKNENPAVKTAGVIDHWNKAGKLGIRRILPDEIDKDISLLKPGLIFVIKTGSWEGHMGFVTGYRNGRLVTIEGNTGPDDDTEGIGVFLRNSRELGYINKGYIDYSSLPKQRHKKLVTHK